MGNIFILDVSRGWILNAIRTFFMFIDCIVYTVVRTFFKTVFQLSNFELTGFYEIFEERVYVILGIFMLFKVTISLITYLVNPDKINDKEQGAGKVVTRIVTVLVMLIALPTFFSLLTEAQNKLLPVIPRIIIGTTNTLSNDDAAGIADSMSLTMLQGFAHAKEECGTSVDLEDHWDLLGAINDPCENNEDIYKYDYFPGISTVVGILMLYVLFSLCITVAIRAFKLIILRMIAPIPIISYVDPKASKDGAFKSWTKMLVSTWAELFMYIGLIYFIIYMIDFLLSGQHWQGFFSPTDNALEGALLLAFIVVGLLFFARQAPKFVFDALGIKNTGSFVKMLGMGAAALGGVGAARAAFRARNEYDDESGRPRRTIRNLGASLFSGLGSAAAGGNAILSTDKPTLMTGFDALSRHNATTLSRIGSGSTFGGRLGTLGQTLWSGQSDYDRYNREIQGYENANKAMVAYKNDLEKKALEQIGDGKKGLRVDVKDAFGNIHTGLNYNEFMTHTEGAKNGNADSLSWFAAHGFSDWQTAQNIVEDLKNAQIAAHAKRVVNGYDYIDSLGNTIHMSGEEYDGTSYNSYRLAADATSGVGMDVDYTSLVNSSGTGLKQSLGTTNREITNRKTDPRYKAAKANADATKKS